ncbi:helix-turn-helix domain-containing protein [Mucilaginibacter terrae]|uniref:Transcriptional regulator with XRE-family HTH domain n=1 Tax=Mucilaginibacter terrae TaxID=1955052 RepID=A0ABU3GWW3_9SPHI|nr:helix-turn-helix transcriptional regulator [Mucilaginibacter terrae]MDT3404258.1 transcriptional regulator with XRE-family HTH domain [Mucilaginibacter terrae]
MKEQEEILLKQIGTAIFDIRIEKGLSQEDVAARCDVDRGKISKIENGSANYYITTLIELAKGLDVDIRRFFDS